MCDEITPPFPHFNGTTIEACEWISNSKSDTQLGMWVFLSKTGFKLVHVRFRRELGGTENDV